MGGVDRLYEPFHDHLIPPAFPFPKINWIPLKVEVDLPCALENFNPYLQGNITNTIDRALH